MVFILFPNQTYISPIWTGDIAAQQINDLNNFISTKKHNLLYLHLMIPHLPARYAQYYFGEEAKNESEAYLLNLKLADKALGDILNAIPEDGHERLLILDSDHWHRARTRNENQPHHSLSIVKVMSDPHSFVNYQPTSGVYTPDLVMDFLKGKIKSNSDVLNYYSDKTYHHTYIPKKH
jgi:hypothetical protein